MSQFNELGTILLVEDHLPLLRGTAFLLDITGFNVITAQNGMEALELLETANPDLIVADTDMPTMNGYELVEWLRSSSRWRHIPVVLTACGYDLDVVDECLKYGANDYLPKPFDVYDLLDVVKRTIPELIMTSLEPLAS